MNKDYQKPDFEYISLIVEEIATDEQSDDFIDGETGLSGSIF